MKLSEIVAKFPSSQDFLLALKAEVIKLGTERADFRYHSFDVNKGIALCSYKGGCSFEKPGFITLEGPDCKGCIFGEALQNMGWNNYNELESRYSINELLEKKAGIPTFQVISMNFAKVQTAQDDGKTWGEAISLLTE